MSAKPYGMVVEKDAGIVARDGVRLSARVSRPEVPGRYPVLLAVSPYQWETDDLPHSTAFLWREVGPVDWYVREHGFVVVHADVRGTGHSAGTYELLGKNEQDDLFDLVTWCAQQPWSNGRVGGLGQSYYAWSQWFMGIVNPPGLACIAPFDGSVDLYRDVVYHGGIYGDFLPWWFQMLRMLNIQRSDGRMIEPDFGRIMAEHLFYDDWWRERSAWERLDEIRVPTLSIGHWGKMGLHLRGNIIGYEKLTAPKQLIVTGARDAFEAHDLFEQTDYHEQVLLPFYRRHLLDGASDVPESSPVRVFVRGIDAYHDEREWPLARASYRDLYLSAAPSGSVKSLNDGSLSWNAPSDSSSETIFDYPDPQWKLGTVAMGPYGPDPIARALTFTSAPLDTDLEITGPASLELFLSSSVSDTEVFARISDQFPPNDAERAGGRPPHSVTLTKGWLRASHRALDAGLSIPGRPFHPHDRAEPLAQDEVVKLEIELMPFSNVFKAGHRIRLELSNGDSPITDGLFVHLYQWFKVGRDTIFHDTLRPSRLILPVVPA
jgi:uncharacterized protein